MFGELLEIRPVIVQDNIKDKDVYYSSHHGSTLVFTLVDNNQNLVARGMGMRWNESFQLQPVMEWGHRFCVEIVEGAMTPGQIIINGMNFLHLNDVMPTYKNLIDRKELTGFVQVAKHENPSYRGLVIDVFQGVKIGGQSGNWNAQSLYLRDANMLHRKRLSGIDWVSLNPSLQAGTNEIAAYPVR